MTFFARPELTDTQFKQSIGDSNVLTLSGQTRIATTSGLTLIDDNGTYIPINVTGGTNYKVMTFYEDKITLKDPSSTADVIYTGASPTTCTVGGLVYGSSICGLPINQILQDILVPTLSPTLISPSASFSIIPTTTIYEVGNTIDISGCTTFNRGCVLPAYCGGSDKRSGSAIYYEYNKWGTPTCSVSTSSGNSISFGVHPVTSGNNIVSSKVWYSSGTTSVYNSDGTTYCSALPSGYTNTNTISIRGIYPYFYGTSASGGVQSGGGKPVVNAAFIAAGTKCVACASNTICINFNSTNDDYIWFAIPNGSTSKTCWYIDSVNNGSIGGGVSPACNLFPNECIVSSVASGNWSNQIYKVYLSNYQTAMNKIIELRNS